MRKGMKIEINAKNVANLDQVHIGDKVKVKYIEELAVYLRKSKTPAESEAVEKGFGPPPRGACPEA